MQRIYLRILSHLSTDDAITQQLYLSHDSEISINCFRDVSYFRNFCYLLISTHPVTSVFECIQELNSKYLHTLCLTSVVIVMSDGLVGYVMKILMNA